MSFNSTGEDLRSIKTKKAIYAAMFSLLKKNSFRKITVKEICEEAMASRATFYSHFVDKYDLLNHWIKELWPKNLSISESYKQIEQVLGDHTRDSMLILKNLLYDADYESLDILFEFILSASNLTLPKNTNANGHAKNVVLSNFYAGGFISYLLWQVRNQFPSNVPIINRHLYEMIHDLLSIQ